MQKLIKNKQLVEGDSWAVVNDTNPQEDLSSGQWILPLSAFLEMAQKGDIDYSRFGVWLANDQMASEIAEFTRNLQIVAIDFPAFADGRAFSQARVLRDQLDYSGEIRATGSFIQDQMFYLSRCGVDAFALNEEMNVESVISSLNDFTETYQAASDEPQPLFRRRVN